MARWEPDARGRLVRAALDLFTAQGYDRTTVAEIARAAGLTESTFFRAFAGKREVLFAGFPYAEGQLADGVREAPATASAGQALAAGLDRLAASFQELQEPARQRLAVVAATPDLAERELTKFAGIVAVATEELVARGAEREHAALLAEVGVAVFRTAVARWRAGEAPGDLPAQLRAARAELDPR